MSRCPECRNAKHANCTGWALDVHTDEIVECSCGAYQCRGGGGR